MLRRAFERNMAIELQGVEAEAGETSMDRLVIGSKRERVTAELFPFNSTTDPGQNLLQRGAIRLCCC